MVVRLTSAICGICGRGSLSAAGSAVSKFAVRMVRTNRGPRAASIPARSRSSVRKDREGCGCDTLLLAAMLFGAIRFDPAIMAAAVAASFDGIAIWGSNSSCAKEAAKELASAGLRSVGASRKDGSQ